MLVLDSPGLRKVTGTSNSNGGGSKSDNTTTTTAEDEDDNNNPDLMDKLGFQWTNPTLAKRIEFVQMKRGYGD